MLGILLLNDLSRSVLQIPDGKPENKFAFDGKMQNRVFALRIVEENHQLWAKKYKK